MRLEKQYATGMDSLVQGYIRLMKLGPALNRRRIYAAWDSVAAYSTCSGTCTPHASTPP